uniref:hypothetical protein n=1 Tax=Streptococcus pluranimalium TaxID=82348 RepID=UPI003F692DDB
MLRNITNSLHLIDRKLTNIEKNLQDRDSAEKLGIKNDNDIRYLKQMASKKIKEKLCQEFPDGYITSSDLPSSYINKFPEKNSVIWEDNEYYLAIKLDYIVDFLNFDITYNSILDNWTVNYSIPEKGATLTRKQIHNPKTNEITYQAEELLSLLSKAFILVNKEEPKETIGVESFIRGNLDDKGYYLDSTIRFNRGEDYSGFLKALKKDEELKIIAQRKMELYETQPKTIVVFEGDSFELDDYKSIDHEFSSRDIRFDELNNEFQNIYSKEPVTFLAKIHKPSFLKMLFFHRLSYNSFKSFKLEGHIPIYNDETIRFYNLINDINHIVYKIHEKFNKQSHRSNLIITRKEARSL